MHPLLSLESTCDLHMMIAQFIIYNLSGTNEKRHFFQDQGGKWQKINFQPLLHGPHWLGKSSHFRSSDQKEGTTSHRPAVQQSTTSGIKIQPHLCGAQISVHWQYQGSSSTVPQQLWLHWRHAGWVWHQDRPNHPTSPAQKAESSHWVQGGDREGASRDGLGKESSPSRLSPHHGPAAWHTPKRQMASWGYALTTKDLNKAIIPGRITRPQPLRR